MPFCRVCGESYAKARAELGYKTCLKHGDPKRVFTIVPVPKSNYMIATSREQLLSPYSHKGTRV